MGINQVSLGASFLAGLLAFFSPCVASAFARLPRHFGR